MTEFEAIFGIKKKEVKKTCILMPLIQKDALSEFKLKKLFRGKLYGSGNNPDFTLIHTGMGSSLVGDATLYLKDTPCKNVVLFGSCGLVASKEGLSIGSLVSPFKCFSHESFSEMLAGRYLAPKDFYPHHDLFGAFLKDSPDAGISKVVCATISSLKLEEDLSGLLLRNGVDVVDMECSAFFSAAHYSGLKGIALFYITDIIKEKPFYLNLEPSLKTQLLLSIKKASRVIYEFIRKNLSG